MNNNSRGKNQLTHFAETIWAAPAKAAEAAPAVSAVGVTLARISGAILAPFTALYRRNRLHDELMELDSRMLADIGIKRADIGRIVGDAYRKDAGAVHAYRGATLHPSAGAKV